MSIVENFEEDWLRTIDKCPICNTKFEQGMEKFYKDTEFIWIAWCKKCLREIVLIHGNNPKEEQS